MDQAETVIIRRICVNCGSTRDEEVKVPKGAAKASVATHMPPYRCRACWRRVIRNRILTEGENI